MFEVIIENEFGSVQGSYQYSSQAEAKRVAKDGAKHHQGRGLVSEDDVIVIEYRYEDGSVNGYDDEGNQITNV